mgnify:FL=1
MEEALKYFKFFMAWGPTIIFVLDLIFAILIGYLRGFRKSIILLIHAFVCATICIILFIFLSESKNVDEFLLSIINKILKSDYGLQDLLNVSHSCSSIRDILVEYIPKQMNFYDGLEIVLKENGAYLLSIVNLAYKLIFALIMYLIFLLFIFIMYLIYVIFYPVHRYKKKINIEFQEGKSEIGYKPKRILGGVVGGLRGFVAGVVSLSFLGSLLFIISGGIGNREDINVESSDESTNTIVSIYNSITSYGEHGIYKVLNSVKDKKDVPYYLYAADLVFQGKLDDPNRGIETTNVYFRDELSAYTDFTYSTVELILKYKSEEIMNAISSGNSNEIMNVLISLFENEGFQTEFKAKIINFDSKTYFINFSLSLLDSMANHIDEMGFASSIPQDVLDLLKIIFKKGYYSEIIPYELYLKDQNDRVALDYIKPSNLLTRDDLGVVLDVVFDAIKTFGNNSSNTSEAIFDYICKTVDKIKGLSILSSSRSNDITPVLRRVFAFVEAKYLTNVDSISNFSSTKYYISEKYEAISWVDELQSLLNISYDGIEIYNDLFKDQEFNLNMFVGILFDIEDPNSEKYKYHDSFNKLIDYISNSALVSELLNSSIVTSAIENSLKSATKGYVLPNDIDFCNVYGDNKVLLKKGEFELFTSMLKALANDSSNKETFIKLISGDLSNENNIDLFKNISSMLTNSNYENKSAVDYASDSLLLNSFLTAFIFNNDIVGNIEIYDSIINTSNNGAKTLDSLEFKLMFNNLTQAIDIVEPILNDSNNTDVIFDILKNNNLNNVLESKVIEGIVNYNLEKNLSDNQNIVIPSNFNYLSSENNQSEAKCLISIVNENKDINFKEIINGSSDVFDIIMEDDNDKIIDSLLKSKILHYTISKKMMDYNMSDMKLIIPNIACEQSNDSNIETIIKKESIKSTIVAFKKVKDVDTNSTYQLLKALSKNKDSIIDSEIVGATIMNFIVKNDNSDIFVVPNIITYNFDYKIKLYEKGNGYYNELDSFIGSLGVLFDFNTVEDNDLSSTLIEKIDSISESDFTTVYNSCIISATISKKTNDAINDYEYDDVINNEVIYDSNKESYYKDEMWNFIDQIRSTLGINLTKLINEENNQNIDFFSKIFNLNQNDYNNLWKSNLLSGIISQQIEINLYNSSDKNKQYIEENIFNSGVVKYMKNELYHFYPEEVYAFVSGIKEVLEIKTSNDIGNLNLDETTIIKSFKNNKDNVNKVYSSVMFIDVVSKMIYDNVILKSEGNIIDTKCAHINDINGLVDYIYSHDCLDDLSKYRLYKKSEVEELLNLYDDKNKNKLSGDMLLTTIEDIIWNGEEVKSYLVYASISKQILTAKNILVLKDDCDTKYETTFIKCEEISRFIASCNTIGLSSISSFNNISNIVIPKDESEAFFKSDIIRVSFSNIVSIKYNETKIYLHLDEESSDFKEIFSNDGVIKYVVDVKYNDISQYVDFADTIDKLAKYENGEYKLLGMTDLLENIRDLEYNKLSNMTKLFLTDYLESLTSSILSDIYKLDTDNLNSYDLSKEYNEKENSSIDDVITVESFNSLKNLNTSLS